MKNYDYYQEEQDGLDSIETYNEETQGAAEALVKR
jgi:hypothetical protein